jgi:alpha-glucuronidase
MNYEKGWLNYHRYKPGVCPKYIGQLYYFEEEPVLRSAIEELKVAAKGMFDSKLVELQVKDNTAVTYNEGIFLKVNIESAMSEEGYRITGTNSLVTIEGSTSRGVLYGVFAFLRRIQKSTELSNFKEEKNPDNPLRMLNHWDNMDGSIERGYAGESFFFKDNELIINNRTKDYARLAASVGINGVVINNVNVKGAATWLITDRYFDKLKSLQNIFKSYGIKLFLSLNFAAPMEFGELSTADPLSEEVKNWWQDRIKLVYQQLPELGGFLIKADSEGRPGPFTYNRSHSEGANMLAADVKPYNGLIIWRCFVYNCKQDWRDKKTDRARASYDNFRPLDGSFDENVILQIKNGPMDFQVREPVASLFGAMNETNQMLEVQIAQEYTGQQKHVCYLMPSFKEILQFHTCYGDKDTVGEIISGKASGSRNCGITAVANTGNDSNWTGHDLAAANLYGFGRLAFEMGLSAEEIGEEWIRATFGNEKKVVDTILELLMMSWPAYEKYTSPLGIGWMVNPNHHFGPNVDGYEYDRWGTYHRADRFGIGVDRSSKGTGYATTYREPNAQLYESKETCPEELLLFFHYVEYNYCLKSGKTLIQHIYDTHFEGVEEAAHMFALWERLTDYIPKEIHNRVKERLAFQKNHAIEWRDVICSYFNRKSGIPDIKGREIY